MCRVWWRLSSACVCSLGVASGLGGRRTGRRRPPAEPALFDQLDANHDGQISPDEIPEEQTSPFRRLLSSADRDGNGRLSRQEFAAGLESRRPKRAADQKLPAEFGGLPQPAAVDEMFRQIGSQSGRQGRGRRSSRRVAAAVRSPGRDGRQGQRWSHHPRRIAPSVSIALRQQLAGKPGEMDPLACSNISTATSTAS